MVNGRLLIRWLREIVRETSGGKENGLLGHDTMSGADRSNPWARSGERGNVSGPVGAIVGDAGTSWPRVTTAEHDGGTPRTKLGKEIADGASVGLWDGLLIVTVRSGDGLREVGHGEDGVQPVEVRFVIVH